MDDLIEMGREFHSFAPLNERVLCFGKFGRDRLSAVAYRV